MTKHHEELRILARALARALSLAELDELSALLRSEATQRIMAAADEARSPQCVGPAITIPREVQHAKPGGASGFSVLGQCGKSSTRE